MLNTSTSLISDVIGNFSDQAAFVYGMYGFVDKMVNGLLIFFMVDQFSQGHPLELKWLMATVPIVCSLSAFALSLFGHKYYSHLLAKISLLPTANV